MAGQMIVWLAIFTAAGGRRLKVTFGERLLELRKNKNISQEEFAEILDVSRQSISKWENDKAYPEMTRLLFMSDYFGVSLDYLMRGIEKQEDAENAAVAYQANNLLAIWNTFISNLSGKQRRLLMFLYALAVCVLIAAILAFLYGTGYVIGEFVGNVAK